MPNFKKNQMNQIVFPMVDKTDFASIESGVTSNITAKFYGVNHGGSAAMTSGSISKTASVVHSGIFRLTLKATETNYDYVLYRIAHASCADQILVFQPAEIDPSDTYSMLSDFYSDFQSRVPKAVATNSQVSDAWSDLRSYLIGMSGMLSDTHSAATAAGDPSVLSDILSAAQQTNSRALVIQSLVSDVDSAITSQFTWTSNALSDIQSDLTSQIGGVTATLSASDISDIASAVNAILASNLSDILSAAQQGNSRVYVVQSQTSDVYSMLSDFYSDFGSRVPKAVATQSLVSNFESNLLSYLVGMSGMLSDTHSAATVAGDASLFSDIYSGVQQTNSRVLVIQSMVSDVQSALSNAHSDIISALGNISVTLTASDISDIASATAAAISTIGSSEISDIASAVYAALVSDLSDIYSAANQTNSRTLVVQSRVSDVYSLLSDVDSQLLINASLASDAHSAAAQANSRALVIQSRVSDVDSALASDFAWLSNALSDIQSDLGSQIGGITAGVSASDISDIASAVYAAVVSDLSDIYSAAVQTNSRAMVNQSRVSDIYSLLSDVQSDFQSRVPKAVATNSLLSDVYSDLLSYLAGISGQVSDLDSQVLIDASLLSDIDSQLTVTHSLVSDIQSAVAALPTGSDIASKVLSAATTNPIDANIQEVNDVTLTGDGAGTPWGPA